MPLFPEDTSIHNIPNPLNAVNFDGLTFQFKYSLIFIKQIREVLP